MIEMTFEGFRPTDFDTFQIEGLEGRMEAIRERIQPKFKAIGEALCDDVAVMAGTEMHVHIAKHARRKTNAPKDTWMAFCHNKRGYKQHPHFQIGVFDDHVFIWLALIYELPEKKKIAETYLSHLEEVRSSIPDSYLLSMDHMKKEAVVIGELGQNGFKEAVERFRDVKSSELLIGRHLRAEDPLLQNGEAVLQTAKQTFETLMPLYRLAMQ
jgi:uncharacterized protein YktB (UPF0637 family)